MPSQRQFFARGLRNSQTNPAPQMRTVAGCRFMICWMRKGSGASFMFLFPTCPLWRNSSVGQWLWICQRRFGSAMRMRSATPAAAHLFANRLRCFVTSKAASSATRKNVIDGLFSRPSPAERPKSSHNLSLPPRTMRMRASRQVIQKSDSKEFMER